MQPCPNCNHMIEPGVGYCPNCGMILTPAAPDLLMTSSKGSDLFLGFLLGAGLVWAAIGLIIDPILYFVYRKKKPSFALGILIGFGIVVVVLGGALAVCGYFIYAESAHK